MFGLFRKSKPVKIRSFNENRKYGVAAKDLKELLKKGCKTLKRGAKLNAAGEQNKHTAVCDQLKLILICSQ
uniref:CIDE-N domain-containing protein n=1 Tax=Seriola dumerili TaxID=41447 RepID=A0A3B4U5J2_SERDU